MDGPNTKMANGICQDTTADLQVT